MTVLDIKNLWQSCAYTGCVKSNENRLIEKAFTKRYGRYNE
jgi:hypothetical protein